MKMKKFLSVACCALMVMSLAGCGSKAANSDKPAGGSDKQADVEVEEENVNSKYRLYDETKDSDAIKEMRIYYHSKTCWGQSKTVVEVTGMGFRWEKDEDYIKDIPSHENTGEFTVQIPDDEEDNLLHMWAYNINDDSRRILNIQVTKLSTASHLVTMDDVTPGTTTYEDVLEMFGRDKASRKDTYEEEAGEDGAVSLKYSVDAESAIFGGGLVADQYTLEVTFAGDSNLVDTVAIEVVTKPAE